MEWGLRVEPWIGVLEWNLEWNEVRFGVIFALLGQDLVLIDQFLVNAYSFGALCTCQALNMCFIIGRLM